MALGMAMQVTIGSDEKMSKSAVSRCYPLGVSMALDGLGNVPPGLQDFSVTSSLLQQQVVCKELNELTVAGRPRGEWSVLGINVSCLVV